MSIHPLDVRNQRHGSNALSASEYAHMELHPLDVRVDRPFKKVAAPLEYTIRGFNLDGIPPIDALLAGRPDRRIDIASHHSGRSYQHLNALDVIAYHIATNLHDTGCEDTVDRWLSELPASAAERFAVSLALHAFPHEGTDESAHEAWRRRLRAHFFRPTAIGSLPTVERILVEVGYPKRDLLTPQHTLQLRQANWRDAAGRSVDAFLVGGALSRLRLPAPPSHESIDQEAAVNIDIGLPAGIPNVPDIIKTKGAVLSQPHRDAIKALLELPELTPKERNLSLGLLTGIYGAPERTNQTIQRVLDCDRANRTMSQSARIAIEQENTLSTPSEPLTL